MSATLSVDDGGVRRIAGALDFDAAAALYGRTGEVLAGGRAVTLDLSGVEAASSAGVALLLEWRRQAHRAGVRLTVSGMPESVRRVARLSGVEVLIESGPDALEARRRERELSM